MNKNITLVAVLLVLSFVFAGCSLSGNQQKAEVISPSVGVAEASSGKVANSEIKVEVKVLSPCRINGLTIQKEGEKWYLAGRIESGSRMVASHLNLRVKALSRDGSIKAEQAGKAKHSPGTNRFSGSQKASFRLPIPAPGIIASLVLSQG